MPTTNSTRFSIGVGVCLWSVAVFAGGGHGGGSHGGAGYSSPHSSPEINAARTVHVSGYYRTDGTQVQAYYRSPPGSALPSSSPSTRARNLPVLDPLYPLDSESFAPSAPPIILSAPGGRRPNHIESFSATSSADRYPGALAAYPSAVTVDLAGHQELQAWILAQHPKATEPASPRRLAANGGKEWAGAFRAQMLPVVAAARRLETEPSATSCQALAAAVRTRSMPAAPAAALQNGAESALRWYRLAADACSQGLRETASLRLDRGSQEVLAVLRSLGR